MSIFVIDVFFECCFQIATVKTHFVEKLIRNFLRAFQNNKSTTISSDITAATTADSEAAKAERTICKMMRNREFAAAGVANSEKVVSERNFFFFFPLFLLIPFIFALVLLD